MHIEKLDLKKTRNMRDLGGIPTADGRKIRHGKLIRSGRLCKLTPETVDALIAMKIDNIIDLRSNREIQEHIPTLIDGVEYHYIPMYNTMERTLDYKRHMSTELYILRKRLNRNFTAKDYMHKMYHNLIFDEYSKTQLAEVFRLFLAEENCILYHCNSGTDRTGIVSMLLESVLGVEKEIIVEDYIASRRFMQRRRKWQRFGLYASVVSRRYKQLLCAMMFSETEYITELMDEIESHYGSVTGYVKEALGVTDEQIELLKDKYLE